MRKEQLDVEMSISEQGFKFHIKVNQKDYLHVLTGCFGFFYFSVPSSDLQPNSAIFFN